MNRYAILLSLFLLSLGGLIARAQQQPPVEATDEAPSRPALTCSLVNGDRLSGRALPLADGLIRLETEYAGAVSLRPATITRCETSDTALQAELDELTHATATTTAAPAQPVSETTVAAAAEEKSAPPAPTTATPAATAPAPKQSEAEEVWKKTIAFSYALSRGNTNVNDMNISGGIEHKEQDGKLVIQGLVRRGTRNGQDFAGLLTSTARYDRVVSTELLAPGTISFFNEVNYEKDAMKRLDHRVAWNGGMQLPLFKKEANELALDLGGGVTREVYSSDIARTLGSGLLRLKSEQLILGRTRLTQQVAAFPDFAEVGRYRLHADFSVTAPLTKIFSVRIGALNRFDNRPQEAVKRNDFSLTSGLAISF